VLARAPVPASIAASFVIARGGDLHSAKIPTRRGRFADWGRLKILAYIVARGVNRVAERKGRVFADRYHARVEDAGGSAERRSLRPYNHPKHQRQHGREPHPWEIDPYSSASGEACWYVDERWRSAMIIAAPESWLLREASP
jgi:hypothetical protein